MGGVVRGGTVLGLVPVTLIVVMNIVSDTSTDNIDYNSDSRFKLTLTVSNLHFQQSKPN